MPTLRLVTLVRLFVALVLGSLVGGAALALWSVQRAQADLARIALTRDSHEAYLRLSADTYRLFKLYGSELLVGEGHDAAAIDSSVRAIRAQLRGLRSLIGREIELVGGDAVGEIDELGRLERTIESLVAGLEMQLASGHVDSTASMRWTTLASLLDDGIDGAFREQIEAALAGERAELAGVQAEAAARARRAPSRSSRCWARCRRRSSRRS